MVIAKEMWFGGMLVIGLASTAPLACATSSSPTNASASSTGPSSGASTSSGTPTTTSSGSGVGGSLATSSSTGLGGSPATTVSSSSTTTVSSSSAATTTTSSSSSSSGACAPQPTADSNAIMCPAMQCTLMGNTGYEYGYGDMGPMTTFCVSSSQACISGTLSPVNPPTYSYYGIGIGINLAGGMPAPPVQLTGSGITVKLSSPPAGGARLLVTVGTTDYCAILTTNPQTVAWADFNSKCYDSPPDGVALTGAPNTPHIEVQAVAGTAEASVDFCIEQLTWQ